MAKRTKKKKSPKEVAALTHEEAKRKNIPTAEYQSVMQDDDLSPVQVAYQRRNRDLDPQLVWRGKDEQDWSDLVVQAPPLFIQEKVHPKVLIDDLMRRTKESSGGADDDGQIDLFADFNGIPEEAKKTEFYQHDANWTNRMILGDSLQVMASLAEREHLRGRVQCIYIDPPYGIKFNSNFQWSTTDKDVRDGAADQITREPEQVKAFRDTWRDGVHSYLTYLRDRLAVARDLLTESGSLFVQIGDENVHRVRAVAEEVFGVDNFVAHIVFTKTTGSTAATIASVFDTLLWFAKSKPDVKVRKLFWTQVPGEEGAKEYKRVETESGDLLPMSRFMDGPRISLPDGARIFATGDISSKGGDDPDIDFPSSSGPIILSCRPNRHWKPGVEGIRRLWKAGRLLRQSGLRIYKRYLDDFPYRSMTNIWSDTRGEDDASYVVQTDEKPVERCILMTSDPGDLVLDPTCGSGTTAYVAEQWGRRWITIDTSRVALALARARIMGSRYPYYLLSDSEEGQIKEAEIAGKTPAPGKTKGDVRQGFVYQRAPHVELGEIAKNVEIDVIWDNFSEEMDRVLSNLRKESGENWEDWEVPEEPGSEWSKEARRWHSDLVRLRSDRQREVEASIARKADFDYLYDKPYLNKSKVRVAGPFTVESLSPHRVPGVDEDDDLIDSIADGKIGYQSGRDFPSMILESLKMSGVQQAHKEDKIEFTSLTPWPGDMIAAEGKYTDGDGTEKRAGIFIGPEFGTVSRPDLVEAVKEAGDAGFDVLIACAFSYAAQASELSKLGRIPILKARMNADLHMAEDLKSTGKGNLFVIFGEPDIDIQDADEDEIQVKINGVDVFDPRTGEVRSDDVDGIACWLIDTDYNEESFFVRHAYFLGANDPYKSLKRTLNTEINEEAWETLHSDTSRPFPKPKSGRIAVKVINHLGDEVMKVFRIGSA